ncbi:CLUMA_CG013116, isoform A [Clunio marinus]|uniref:CLUMA_CG013116, isoform A n=1 Tax=Clunio marinus TaxID=568069 RepID=A0A1J1IHY2_9DIPT|nr:CLUMA_CG013116, isoform A [Clunio marinus]
MKLRTLEEYLKEKRERQNRLDRSNYCTKCAVSLADSGACAAQKCILDLVAIKKLNAVARNLRAAPP